MPTFKFSFNKKKSASVQLQKQNYSVVTLELII